MKTKHEIIHTHRIFKEGMITCGACKHKFILNAVMVYKNEYKNDVIDLIPQSRVYFCPYCGEGEDSK